MDDDIIRMAREAQQERLSLDGRSVPSTALSGYWFSMEVADLARFADIVRAAALAQQAEQAWVCPDSPEHRYAKPGHCEDCGKTLVQEQGCDHCNHPLYAATKCRVCGRVTEQAEPVEGPETVDQRVGPLVESALQAVAEKIGDQCAVWYGIGARDVEEVLREAARYGLVHGTLAEPVAGAVLNEEGRAALVEHGTEDWHCVHRNARRLYTAPPQQAEPVEPVAWVGDPSTQDYASTVPDPQVADRLARHGIPMPEGDPK